MSLLQKVASLSANFDFSKQLLLHRFLPLQTKQTLNTIRNCCHTTAATTTILQYFNAKQTNRCYMLQTAVYMPGILFQNICGHLICHLTALGTR